MKHYTIATIAKINNEHSWFRCMEQGIVKFGKETGHTTFMLGPSHADEQLQLQLIEDIVSQRKIDALCIVPLFPQALELALRKIRNQGIVVITHEASNQRNTDYDLEAVNNTLFGERLLDLLVAEMGEEGQYAIFLGSLMAKSHSEWAQAIVTRQRVIYPKLQLATRKIEDHDDRMAAYSKTKELLTENPAITGIIAMGTTSCEGVALAVEESGRQESVTVVGTGMVSTCKHAVMSGVTTVLCTWNPRDAGYAMNALALKVLNGEPIQEGMDLGVAGYHQMVVDGKILCGSAMRDITKETISMYDF